MSVKTAAIKKAIQILEALGAVYEIEYDGKDYRRGKPRRKYTKHQNDFASTGYVDKLKALNVGDVAVIENNGFDIEKFRSAISAKAVHQFGAGACQTYTNRKENTIEVLRIK